MATITQASSEAARETEEEGSIDASGGNQDGRRQQGARRKGALTPAGRPDVMMEMK